MKGNEVRVVFFLQPVDQVRDGKVAKVEPFKNSLGVVSFLLLALLLVLGVLVYLSFNFEVDPSQAEATTRKPTTTTRKPTTTTSHTEATSKEPLTENTTEATSQRDDENTTESSSGKIG